MHQVKGRVARFQVACQRRKILYIGFPDSTRSPKVQGAASNFPGERTRQRKAQPASEQLRRESSANVPVAPAMAMRCTPGKSEDSGLLQSSRTTRFTRVLGRRFTRSSCFTGYSFAARLSAGSIRRTAPSFRRLGRTRVHPDLANVADALPQFGQKRLAAQLLHLLVKRMRSRWPVPGSRRCGASQRKTSPFHLGSLSPV